MKAVNQAKINERERVELGSVVPLLTPFSVGIEPSSHCNLKCEFCYHYDTEAIKQSKVKFGNLDFELYKKIIDDLSEFPSKVKKLKFGGFGEPLFNKMLPQMIGYAKEKNIAERLELYTNAILLNERLSDELIEAGIDWINISVNGVSTQDYSDRCNSKIDFERYIREITYLFEHRQDCHIYIKLGDNGFTKEAKEKFGEIFENICDTIYIENIVPNIWSGADVKVSSNEKSVYNSKIEYKEVCPFLFIYMIINNDGTVISCCSNWKKENVIGDMKTQSALDIWQRSDVLYNLQTIHLSKERENISMCKGCEALMSCTTDDIDQKADILLKAINSRRIEHNEGV